MDTEFHKEARSYTEFLKNFSLNGIRTDENIIKDLDSDTFTKIKNQIKMTTDSTLITIIKQSVDSNPKLDFEQTDKRAFIKFKLEITKGELQELLELLWKYNFEIAFHDTVHPTISEPGAFFSYSTEKNIGQAYWSMTFGNHGWSGGIYHLKKETVSQQIYNLIQKRKLDKIQITDVHFFSHYDIESEAKSKEKNDEIFSMHSQ